MASTKLNTAKLEFIKEFLNEKDEDLVKEQIAFYHALKQSDAILNIPRTEDELKASVKKAEKDYQNCIFFSTEEVFEKYRMNSRKTTDLL